MKTKTSPHPDGAATLVLASSSSYRRELLERLGLPFSVAAPAIEETALQHEIPAQISVRLAEAKARAVADRYPRALIIGCGQVAACDGVALGKPRDRDDALAQLTAMRGRTIVFHTALALLNARTDRCQTALVDVASTFRTLSDSQLAAYIDRDQPYDCAGSVKCEALGIALFSRIASDDPTALIGLPLIRLTDMLAAEGVQIL
ncbi:MAG: Maf family nucleotide pyrophosphatase [Pseudomonadota bacterium]|nr:Maf family nucleotide pyrophosphatase [Pseudomonadota bacterium]